MLGPTPRVLCRRCAPGYQDASRCHQLVGRDTGAGRPRSRGYKARYGLPRKPRRRPSTIAFFTKRRRNAVELEDQVDQAGRGRWDPPPERPGRVHRCAKFAVSVRRGFDDDEASALAFCQCFLISRPGLAGQICCFENDRELPPTTSSASQRRGWMRPPLPFPMQTRWQAREPGLIDGARP